MLMHIVRYMQCRLAVFASQPVSSRELYTAG